MKKGKVVGNRMNFNEETVRRLRGLIVFTVAVVVVGVNYQKLLAAAGALLKMLSPFLLGGAIAFALNVPMHVSGKPPVEPSEQKRKPVQAAGLPDPCHCRSGRRFDCCDGTCGSGGCFCTIYDAGEWSIPSFLPMCSRLWREFLQIIRR